MKQVTDEASFIDDLGADSLDTVELVMAFEEEFWSEIDSEAEKILTVGDAIKFIETKLLFNAPNEWRDNDNSFIPIRRKTTLVKLLSERKGFVTSISHTTRTPDLTRDGQILLYQHWEI